MPTQQAENSTLELEKGKFYKNQLGETCYISEKTPLNSYKVYRVNMNGLLPNQKYYWVYPNGVTNLSGEFSEFNLVSVVDKLEVEENIVVKDWPEFTLGTDPEMILFYEYDFVHSRAWMQSKREKYAFGQFGTDGHDFTAEWRPKESYTPMGLVKNLQSCFVQAIKDNAALVHMEWRAGAYIGSEPIGGHIHFGMKKEPKMCEMLNRYLAGFYMLLEPEEQAKKRKEQYGGLGDARDQDWGWEYRTLSSWIYSPTVSYAVLCLAKHIINQFKIPGNNIFGRPKVFGYLTEKINEQYKAHNVEFFKGKFEDQWSEVMSWPIEPSLLDGLKIFQKLIEEGYKIGEGDFKFNWGIKIND